MTTPIGTDTVTSVARRYILPEVVDNVYNSNVITFRLNSANKRLIQGGTQIEVPLMYARFAAGGPYRGYDLLNVAPSDTVKNGAWDWKQHYVPVTVDGLTLIKTDSADAIVNFINMYFAQAEMEMAENIGVGLFSNPATNPKDIDGFQAAIDDGTVAATYAGLDRTANAFHASQVDSATAALTLTSLQSMFGNASEGGRHPTIIVSRQEQYNRFWALNVVNQDFPATMPTGSDEQLAAAGFTNQLFNGVPWVVDSHVQNGPNGANSAILFLNEDYIFLAVSPRADFYLEDFQTPVNQDAMVAKMLWAGNLVVTNVQRQGKMTNVSS
jgi:hypothetical protein